MIWQHTLRDELVARLPPGACHWVVGSSAGVGELDGWSDLDLHVELGGGGQPLDVLDNLDVWACTEEMGSTGQVLRVVLSDGRRLDLVVTGGRVRVPPLAADNDVRFLAALAATKLGRGDQLIGLHLLLDLLRSSLVLAMQLRDRDLGTTIHRRGATHDALAAQVTALLTAPPTPDLVLRAVDLYAAWRTDLEPTYTPDWSPLEALIARGQSTDKEPPDLDPLQGGP